AGRYVLAELEAELVGGKLDEFADGGEGRGVVDQSGRAADGGRGPPVGDVVAVAALDDAGEGGAVAVGQGRPQAVRAVLDIVHEDAGEGIGQRIAGLGEGDVLAA